MATDSAIDRFWKWGTTAFIGCQIDGAVEITEEEYAFLKREESVSAIRDIRDQKIEAVEWRVRRHQDEVALGLTPTENITPVLLYMQALRGVPQQQGFPDQIEWPVLQEG
jgi:transcriptional accessory protein Tex/SPT6